MYRLIIGNKNYSSWSLRPWLLMKVAGIGFEEVSIPIYSEEGKEALAALSATAKVPLLVANEQTIWDSLSIVEYLAEQHPEKALWPLAKDTRAIARSVTSEMHSSFNEVRNTLPMNCRRLKPYTKIYPALQKDIDRIHQIWEECRQDFGQQGDFLFGNFSIADAFYAPIVLRFHSYEIPATGAAKTYMENMLKLPALQEWVELAKAETTVVPAYELD